MVWLSLDDDDDDDEEDANSETPALPSGVWATMMDLGGGQDADGGGAKAVAA